MDRETAWRLAPLGLLVLAAVAYLWNLTASGYANTYYSAAAQAASQSWSAMFFGSIDAAGFITVDKPPVSLWAMGLSVRVLGLNPFAILLPEALAGIGAVLLLWDAVRRQLGREAALLVGDRVRAHAGAVLMFRYNNPDAVLVLLLVGAAWALVRGLAAGRLRWAVLAAVLVGFAFLTKYLQAYLVLPAFALTWLVAAPGSLRRRLGGARRRRRWRSSGRPPGGSLIVDLLPAADRPYMGGVHEQHGARPAAGLRRPGPDLRREATGARRAGRARRGRRLRRRARAAAPVQRRVGRADRLAAPGGRDRPRGRARGTVARATDGPASRRLPPVGHLGARPRARVLADGAGSSIRYYAVALAPALGGAGRRRRRRAVAARARTAAASVALGAMVLVDRCRGLAAARADAGLLAGAGARRAVRRRAPRRSSSWGRR